MDWKTTGNRLANTAIIFFGVMSYAFVLFTRRYDVITLVVRLRRLKLNDPDIGWLAAGLALSLCYGLGIAISLRSGRGFIEGRLRGGGVSMLVAGLLIAIASILALNRVLDTYGWNVQL